MKLLLTAMIVLTGHFAVHAGTNLYLRKGTFETKKWASLFSTTQTSESSKFNEYVVQFKEAPTESDRAALISRGVEIFKYLPDDSYIIRVEGTRINGIRHLAQVHAVIPYTAFIKMSSDFEGFSILTKDKIENVLIKTFRPEFRSEIIAGIKNISSEIGILYAEDNSILANIPQNLIVKVAELSGIDHVQPYVPMTTLNNVFDLADDFIPTETAPVPNGDYTDLLGNEDGTRIMNFESAWKESLAGKGQLVAMADTGLDSGDLNTIHKDLQGAIYKGYSHGIFAKSWNDPMGHGTHVAGSIVSRGVLSNGRIKGGAYEAMIIAQGMWSPMMENLTVPPQLKTLFQQAYDDGARVHSDSWGAAKNFGVYDTFAEQVDTFAWEHPEMLPIFAAGNSGADKDKDGRIDENSIGTPGTAKNVMTVGASENLVAKGGIQVPIKKLRSAPDSWPADPINSDYVSNNENGLGMFSSRGPTVDGRTKPDIVAPGTNILSLKSQVEGASDLWGSYNKWYAWSGGTSMSTPLTAAAALITRQKLQQLGFNSPSGALVKGMLMHTAVELFPGQYGEVGKEKGQEILSHRPNSDEGFGRVDVDRVIHLPTKIIDEKQGVAQGQELKYEISLKEPVSKVWATMVYFDAPASSSAAQALVNNIDLSILTPQGQTLAPHDSINNQEYIEISGGSAGTYIVTVKGVKIPQGKSGKQPFALMISAVQ